MSVLGRGIVISVRGRGLVMSFIGRHRLQM